MVLDLDLEAFDLGVVLVVFHHGVVVEEREEHDNSNDGEEWPTAVTAAPMDESVGLHQERLDSGCVIGMQIYEKKRDKG